MKMIEDNKKLRDRLAQKEAKLQEYVNYGPRGKVGIADRIDMHTMYRELGDKSKESYECLDDMHSTLESKNKR